MLKPSQILYLSLHSCPIDKIKKNSKARYYGLLFGLPLLSESPLTLEYLTNMILPGFILLGVKASLEPILLADKDIGNHLKYFPAVMLITIPEAEINITEFDSTAETIQEETEILNWEIISDIDLLQQSVPQTHWLKLQNQTKIEPREDSILKALLRAVAYSSAYPERITDTLSSDTAEMLYELAASRRTPYALRLRRSAKAFENGDYPGAMHHLLEGILKQLRLSGTLQSALLSLPGENLDKLQCRELIYLARAGTLEMKLLAGARLSMESHNVEVLSTLAQLKNDPHPWVRAAANIIK